METSSFLVHAIDPAVADRLRAGGGLVKMADSEPGWPCRQCLRDVHVGERVLLVSYDPFDASCESPYHTASPIFLHLAPCAPAATPIGELPVQLTSRRLSLRAFDADAMMREGRVVEGQDLGKALSELFSCDDVVDVHVHNAAPGCFAARVTRGS